MSLDYTISILKIILFDLVLSGDNAVVIGLAAHRLPPVLRRQAMIWGCGMAIVMRIGLTMIVSLLLIIPGLRFIGAVLLVWIAAKLIMEEEQPAESVGSAPASLWKAVQRIALADFIMSLDNVLAIASASDGEWVRVVLGLVLSIGMLLFFSSVIAELMNRYPWIAYAGAAILAWTAADMMAHDLEVFFGKGYASSDSTFPRWGVWVLHIALVTLCLTVNRWMPGDRPPAEPTTLDEQADEDVEHSDR